jgi:hypothetical protein
LQEKVGGVFERNETEPCWTPMSAYRVKAGKIWGVFVSGILILAGLFFLRAHFPHHYLVLPLRASFPIPKGQHESYSTNFPAREIPISEGRRWTNGNEVGLDWTDVATTPGLAYSTESGTGTGSKAYDDSTALLVGTWGPDQTVEATVHSANQDDGVFEEVELRLRSSISGRVANGYEVLFRCLKTPEAYASIVRWDGPLGRFTYLSQKQGPEYGVSDGDLVKATIIGNVITAYINGTQALQAIDATYSTGSPGMGFWLKRHSGIRNWLRNISVDNIDYGFTRFAAWD